MAEVISVLSRKGGVGKTLTAMYTVALLKTQGRDVAVLDKDPEGSAGAWARAAGNLPFPVYPEGKQAQAMKHAVVVVDTPPNDPKALGDAARMAARVLVVAKCNALEADRLVPTLDALAASGFSGPWGILLTQARGGLGREMKAALEDEDLPVYGIIPHLIKFERAFGTLPDDLTEYREALAEVLA
ncbi:AAA family ATPase [Deinococcus sp. HMF7620]|uniref:AAA family ATPase n=1 Tax=Deinococcus arboris TaxID=2682977 RepID=A0A7C9HS83_9DEIO|nr:ParA family protein [Deinococcus arboris]MVN87609.1 AAA family ATPase [Deinococcus arboris]